MGYSIRTPQFRYTEWARGSEGFELYDYSASPAEFENLVTDDAYQDVLVQMQSLMNEKLEKIE